MAGYLICAIKRAGALQMDAKAREGAVVVAAVAAGTMEERGSGAQT